jgi:hypothetical protein
MHSSSLKELVNYGRWAFAKMKGNTSMYELHRYPMPYDVTPFRQHGELRLYMHVISCAAAY